MLYFLVDVQFDTSYCHSSTFYSFVNRMAEHDVSFAKRLVTVPIVMMK